MPSTPYPDGGCQDWCLLRGRQHDVYLRRTSISAPSPGSLVLMSRANRTCLRRTEATSPLLCHVHISLDGSSIKNFASSSMHPKDGTDQLRRCGCPPSSVIGMRECDVFPVVSARDRLAVVVGEGSSTANTDLSSCQGTRDECAPSRFFAYRLTRRCINL